VKLSCLNCLNPTLSTRFKGLGNVIKNVFPIDWGTSPWNLDPPPSPLAFEEDVVGPRSDDAYDVYLEAGQELTQEISGLIVERTYLMRIRVLADPSPDPDCENKEILTFGVSDSLNSEGTSREMNNIKGYFRNDVLHHMFFVATKEMHEIFVESGGENKENCKGPLIRQVILELMPQPNLVKDHRFEVLGLADSSVQDLDWKVKPDTLGSGDVKGPRSNGAYDVYLEAGQTLTQEISGLIMGRTYQMRIRVLADPSPDPVCENNEILTFGVSEGTSREMNNIKGYFRNDVLHHMFFVATEVKHEIFVESGGVNKENCKGPLVREVFLELDGDGEGDGDTFSPKAQSSAMRISSFSFAFVGMILLCLCPV
jgi:hypothetical protein